MKFKPAKILIFPVLIFSGVLSHAHAENISRGDVYSEIGQYIETPDSFQYINLLYADIEKNDTGFSGLQKLVYTGKIRNKPLNVFPEKIMTQTELYTLLDATADKNFNEIQYLKSGEGYVKETDIDVIKRLYGESIKISIGNSSSNIDSTKLRILNDVYDSLNANHYASENFTETQLIDSAIEGLARGTDDIYTSYFPPSENKDFQQELQGEFSGIGAHVDMVNPGEVIIVAPLKGSPAEQAGIRAGDIIYAIDGVEISPDQTLSQATSKIKGPEGTQVVLSVLRNGVKREFTVTRGLIIVPDIEGEKINNSTYYISMRMFTSDIANEFADQVEVISDETGIEKIIIDLRNNPGGFLDQVVDILGYFVAEGEPVAIVKYKDSEQVYKSYGYNEYNFQDKEIVILINEGSASASEILAGTLKDYFPEQVTTVGKQTFGKGSVQTQRAYIDGSALKYTIANWYTGKTEKGIDGVGITPDIIVEFDEELYKNEKKDTQLLEAINL